MARRKPKSDKKSAPPASRLAALEAEVQDLREQLALERIHFEAALASVAETRRELEASRERYAELYDTAPVGYVLLDRNGFIHDANLTVARMVGIPRERLRGTLLSRFVAKAHRRTLLHHLSRCRHSAGDEDVITEVRAGDHNEQPLYLSLRSRTQSPPAVPHHLVRFRTALVDITERKQMETALRESEARLRLFIEHAPSALAMFDRHMRYLAVSRRWMDDYGVGDRSLIGRSHYDVFPEISDRWKAVHQRGLAGEVVQEEEECFERADGSVQWLRWEVRPWLGNDSQVGGIVIFTEDITERKTASDVMRDMKVTLEQRVKERTAALVEANERWDWVVRATNDGVWDWDLVHDTAYFSPRWKEMHGFLGSDRTESTKEWLARIHPEDRHRVCQALNRCQEDQRSPFHQEYRIQRKGETYFWVLDRSIAIFDEKGHAIRMVGAETDVTWRKEVEEALREREAQLRELGARLLQAQEEERRRISRDLHDDIMQRMGALTMTLYHLTASISSQDERVQSEIKACGTDAEQITTDLQRLAHSLHPSVLEFAGLELAMREQVDEFARRTGLMTEVLCRRVPQSLSLDHSTCLYRVLQEALQNVQKHANATTVLVSLLRTGHGLGLCIIDDGRGIEGLTGTVRPKGLGLTSMNERVRMLGGSFRIRSKPDEGTELHAWVPWEDVVCES